MPACRAMFVCMYFHWLNLSSEIILNIYRDKTYNSWKREIIISSVAEKRTMGERTNERTIEWTNDAFIRILFLCSRARQHDEPKFEESHSSKDKLLGYNKSVKYNWLHLSNELRISHECEQSQSEWHMHHYGAHAKNETEKKIWKHEKEKKITHTQTHSNDNNNKKCSLCECESFCALLCFCIV